MPLVDLFSYFKRTSYYAYNGSNGSQREWFFVLFCFRSPGPRQARNLQKGFGCWNGAFPFDGDAEFCHSDVSSFNARMQDDTRQAIR
jgi:hypothetical protein